MTRRPDYTPTDARDLCSKIFVTCYMGSRRGGAKNQSVWYCFHVTFSCAQVLGRRDARAREAARRSDRIDTHFDRYRRHHQRRAGEICRDHAEIRCDRCSRAIATPGRISRHDLPQASFSGMDVHSGLAINRDDVCTAPKMEGGTSTENLALQNIQALRIEQKMIVLSSHGHA